MDFGDFLIILSIVIGIPMFLWLERDILTPRIFEE